MKFTEIPEAFGTRLRLHIIASLLHKTLDFKTLREITGATDGNLSAQLIKLDEMGYITVEKKFVDRRPQSTYTITEKAFDEYKEFATLLVYQMANKEA
ncbi:MAG: transcriptional regulator [Oscillospiraceae bacterium]|nr:transcriptional regulator [Oscillospiraceae bacterium]